MGISRNISTPLPHKILHVNAVNNLTARRSESLVWIYYSNSVLHMTWKSLKGVMNKSGGVFAFLLNRS